MGVTEKRAKQKEAFRGEILDSARKIFIKRGYDGFSMRKLAEKIDYSPTTIYLYFKNKDELLLAICEEFFETFLTELNRIRSASRDPLKTLRQAVLYLINFGIENPDQYKLIFFTKSVYGTHKELVEKETMARNTYFVFMEIVQECITAGKLRKMEADVIADTFAIASHGLVAKSIFCANSDKDKSEVVALTLVDALLRGLRK